MKVSELDTGVFISQFFPFRAQELFDDVLEKLDVELPNVRQLICRNYAEFCYYHACQKDLAIPYYKKVLLVSFHFLFL